MMSGENNNRTTTKTNVVPPSCMVINYKIVSN